MRMKRLRRSTERYQKGRHRGQARLPQCLVDVHIVVIDTKPVGTGLARDRVRRPQLIFQIAFKIPRSTLTTTSTDPGLASIATRPTFINDRPPNHHAWIKAPAVHLSLVARSRFSFNQIVIID